MENDKTEKAKIRRLIDLEDRISDNLPLGRPVIIKINGYDEGISYTCAIGENDGLCEEDRIKIHYAFLREIDLLAPRDAEAFSASDIERLEENFSWRGGKAVQYYKLRREEER